MEKLMMHTQDIADANIEKIGSLFPNCLTERVVGKDKDGNDIIGRGIIWRCSSSCARTIWGR